MPLRLFLFFFFFLLQNSIFAQQVVSGFKRFGRAEGVPNSSNNKIFESSDHFLWLSTGSGLYRFDGYQFNPFFSNSKDSTTLSSNVLSDIEEDRFGNLWVGTFGKGVNRLDRKTGKWKQYIHPTKDANSFYWIFDLFKDSRGRLWLGTNGRGLLLFDEKEDSFRQFIPDPKKNRTGTASFENEVRGITADVNDPDILWLAGTDGLYMFDTKLELFTCYKNIKNGKADWINNSFHTVYAQNASSIWLGAWGGGLIHFNTGSAVFTNYPPSPKEYLKQNLSTNIILNIEFCTDTSLYVSSVDAGLFEFNLHQRTFKQISDAQAHDGKNISMEFKGITHSSDGSTWICSADYIFQKHPVYKRMGMFQSFYQPKEKFVYRPTLNGVLYRKDSGQYWMSCNAGFGVYVYNSNFHYLRSVAIEGSATDKKLREIVVDASGATWLRSADVPYLYFYEKATDQFIEATFKFKDASFISSEIQEMATDNKGNVWFANKDLLIKWDPLKKQLQNFSITENQKNNNNLQWVKLRFDANDDPWLVTNTGLHHFKFSSNQWEHFYALPNNHQSLANTSVESIAFDKKGNCWIAPVDEGLQVYDTATKNFIRHYIQSEGFIAQRVNDLVTDSNGDLWAATNNGLVRYNYKNDNWQTFNQEDGLPTDNLDLLFSLADGTMILSIQDGFVHWNIHSLPLNNQKPIVYFNRFSSGGKYPAVKNNRIYLPYSNNELSVEFSAIATIMGDRTKFYYKILPRQKEWIATNQRSISLATLAPGEYTLQIKALNSDGVESDIKELDISVAYPYWEKWWFILLVILFVASILYLLYRFRVQQLMQMVLLRNNISRDLHDEIGSSVSSVNMLSIVAKKQLGEEHPVTPLLAQISQSAQNAGDSINEIIWSINPKNDSIERIVLHMKELAAEMLEPLDIAYQLDFDSQLIHLDIPMQDRRHLFMIYKEALNNIIKYAHCKNVLLSMFIKDNTLLMKIEDDGKGFDIADHKPGNGLVNMRQRAAEMKAEIMIITSPGNGCSIHLHYPLK